MSPASASGTSGRLSNASASDSTSVRPSHGPSEKSVRIPTRSRSSSARDFICRGSKNTVSMPASRRMNAWSLALAIGCNEVTLRPMMNAAQVTWNASIRFVDRIPTGSPLRNPRAFRT